MEVQTKTMGLVKVDESRLLNFPKGLFGFEDYHKYALIEAEYEGQIIRTLLQNAETIRIVDENDNPLSVADVKPGDKVKVYIESNARHFGIAIDETIIEQ